MLTETSAVGDDSTLAAASVSQQSQHILAHATFGTATHDQLVRSAKNARRKPCDRRELKALVRAQGLLQNLVCHIQMVDGIATGLLEVVAGDGRWQVIGELIAEGDLPRDYQILYQLVDEADAVVVSLAENLGRSPLHPADLSEGMLALAAAGRGVADIALTFGVPELTVRQRLKLANVAPALFAMYRNDQISYEQLAALAVSDNHEAQQAAWDGLPSWQRHPSQLRHVLTAHSVPLRGDPVARYVGLKAYTAAGGLVTRDLFSDKDDGYIEDVALLERLAQAKLERLAARYRKEKWSWVAVQVRTDPAALAQYGRVRTVSITPTPEQQAKLDQLAARAAALEQGAESHGEVADEAADCIGDVIGEGKAESEEESEDEDDGATVRELAAIDIERGRIRMALSRPDPGDKALAGVLLTVDEHGKACVLRDLIRPQDKPKLARHADDAAGKASKLRGPHSERLLILLSAQRSVALRAELASQPQVALLVLAHQLLSAEFFSHGDDANVVQLRLRAAVLPPEVESGAAWQAWQAQRTQLAAQLPPNGGVALMEWLQRQPREEVDAAIAFCLSCAVNGIAAAPQPCDAVLALSRLVGLDMQRYWQPTAQGYFQHVSKARILEVVAQAVSPQAAVPLEKLPKDAAAQAAERALTDSGWLPEPLTMPVADAAQALNVTMAE